MLFIDIDQNNRFSNKFKSIKFITIGSEKFKNYLVKPNLFCKKNYYF